MSSEKTKTIKINAPMQAVVHQLNVAVGDSVTAGQEVAVLEAMKMQHGITATTDGVVKQVHISLGDVVEEKAPIVTLTGGGTVAKQAEKQDTQDLDAIRPDLAELNARLERTQDAARSEQIARRHEKGHRSARENVDDLCDAESFIEYGQLVVAAQRETGARP